MKNKKVMQSIGLFSTFIGLLVMYWLVYVFDPELHRTYVQYEDRLVEWLTFFFFMLASMITFWTIKYRDKTRKNLCYLILMGSFFFICAGEEISWGQRVFGIQTPLEITQINEQNEINLHNISYEHIHPYGLISTFILLYGIVLPLFLLKAHPDSTLRRYISPPFLVPCFFFPMIIKKTDDFVTSLIVQSFGADTVGTYVDQTAELQEMYWGICLFLAARSIFIEHKRLNKNAS